MDERIEALRPLLDTPEGRDAVLEVVRAAERIAEGPEKATEEGFPVFALAVLLVELTQTLERLADVRARLRPSG